MADKWIGKATQGAHGQFRAKATRRGMSTSAFASEVLANPGRYSERTRQQANLARTLGRLNR